MIDDDYCGYARWDWMMSLASILEERARVGNYIANNSWDDLPDNYKRNYPDRDLPCTAHGLGVSV